MKYAFCNEMFGDEPQEEAFRYCADLGYTGVEIAPFTLQPGITPFDIHKVAASNVEKIVGAAQQTGLQIVGMHWLFAKTHGLHLTSADAATRHRTTSYLVALAEVCASMGGSILVLGSPQQRSFPTRMTRMEAEDSAVEVLQAAMPRFESLGITIAAEPLGPEETNFMNTAGDAVAIVSRVGSLNCRLNLDVKAMSTEEATIPQIIHENREYIAHFHANDPNRSGPGMGDVDFRPIMTALHETGYDGWLSVEAFQYEPNAREIVRQSIANLLDAEL